MQTLEVRRWDPLVRLTHWGVAAGVVANGVFTEEGSGPHQWVGYGVAALLALRWAWGLIGPPEARFTAFRPSLGRAARHVREIVRGAPASTHRSHNPLGALMVYALWGTLAVVIGTGVAMSGPPGVSTPRIEADSIAQPVVTADADDDDDRRGGDREDRRRGEGGGEAVEEAHEVGANLLFGLAGLHLLGVAFETRRSGRGILQSMLPGRRAARSAR